MTSHNFSYHAQIRKQQRAVPQIIVEWLQDYGRVIRKAGADVYYLDKKARRKLRRDIGSVPYRRMEDLLDAYVVIADDGSVVTVGWRYKRLKH